MKFDPYQIVLEPQISEKALRLAEKENKYTFRVARRANKVEVRRAIEAIFKVKVLDVNTINMRGKRRRVRWREGHRPDWKKAIVTLAEGQKIELM